MKTTTKRKILSLTISAILTAGVAGYPMSSYAKDDGGDKKTKVEEKKKEDSSKAKPAVAHTDSNKRSATDSGNKSHQKITICHVPPGNPEQKHTLHIAFSAWAAHKAHTNDKGPDYVDYLGSCNSKTSTTPKETLHIISGCTGAAHETLETKVQSYFEPITVADTALDDEAVVTAMSQCLDKGDSSDSSDSNKGKAKGGGHDSVSDSGKHHRIRGCQDKGDSSDKKYRKTLQDADTARDNNAAKGILKDPVVVSDSSLDDSGVWKEYKKCVADTGSPNKIDSGKTGKKRGDSGHSQHILKSCGDAQDQKLKDAIVAYKAKPSSKDIILTETSYTDVSIKQAVDACVSAGATDSITSAFSTNVTLPCVPITNATITNAVVNGSTITGGTVTAGTSATANVIGGILSAGTVSGGTTSGTTLTGADISCATVSPVTASGRLNFRENTAPISPEPTSGDVK
ncbi:MAG: hypothetical protein EPN17_16925 [Methylobacter sp.]|nr:MAG: hypothetical protein EPN17_16925 [Methylobacter sp.]